MSPLLTHHFYFSIRKSNSYNSIQDLFWILLMGWLNQYYPGPFISTVISSLSEEWGASHSTSDYSSSPKIFDISFMINTTSSVIYHSVGLYLRWCLFFFTFYRMIISWLKKAVFFLAKSQCWEQIYDWGNFFAQDNLLQAFLIKMKIKNNKQMKINILPLIICHRLINLNVWKIFIFWKFSRIYTSFIHETKISYINGDFLENLL